MMTMGHGVSVLLVTSAVGYWTLTIANKEKGRVKALGQYLGLLIMVVSLIGGACKAYCAVRACQSMAGGKMCHWGAKKWGIGGGAMMCPAGHPNCPMNCPPEGEKQEPQEAAPAQK